jgi:hypothetical protein
VWNRSDFLPGIEDGEFGVSFFDANLFSHKSSSGEYAEAFEADVPGSRDLAENATGFIFDGRQSFGSGTRTGGESADGRFVSQRLMWPNQVVDVPSPAIDVVGKMFEGVASDMRPDFSLQCPVEPFDLALRLRVVGPSMDWLDAESNQLCVEPTDSFGCFVPGSESVITEDAFGESEFCEGFPERLECGFHGDIQARPQCNEIARMIIDDGEGMDFSPTDFDGSFVIALPELMGFCSFKELDVLFFCACGSCESMSAEDVGDGSGRRKAESFLGEESVNFACAPAELFANFEDAVFDVLSGSRRRNIRSSRTIGQGFVGPAAVTSDPFVPGLAANLEVSTRLRERNIQSDHLMNKRQTNFGHGSNFPGHRAPPFWSAIMPQNRHPCLFHNCDHLLSYNTCPAVIFWGTLQLVKRVTAPSMHDC